MLMAKCLAITSVGPPAVPGVTKTIGLLGQAKDKVGNNINMDMIVNRLMTEIKLKIIITPRVKNT
jgi:hypothetical protein